MKELQKLKEDGVTLENFIKLCAEQNKNTMKKIWEKRKYGL